MLTSVFYSLKDTATPVWVALAAFFCNAIACVLLVGPLGFGGLALATSIAGILNMVILFVILSRRLGPFGGSAVIATAVKNLILSAIMGLAIYMVLVNSSYSSKSVLGQASIVIFLLIIAVAIYLILSWILKLPELDFIKGFLKGRGENKST